MTTAEVSKPAKSRRKNPHQPCRQRTYNDNERAAALAVLERNNGSLHRTEQDTGIPRKTLENWSRRVASRQLSPAKGAGADHLLPEASKVLDTKLDAIAHRMADIVLEKPAEDISARDAMVSLGIAVDKRLLRQGMPTVIHGQSPLGQLSPDQLHALRSVLAGEVTVVDATPPALPAAVASETTF